MAGIGVTGIHQSSAGARTGAVTIGGLDFKSAGIDEKTVQVAAIGAAVVVVLAAVRKKRRRKQ